MKYLIESLKLVIFPAILHKHLINVVYVKFLWHDFIHEYVILSFILHWVERLILEYDLGELIIILLLYFSEDIALIC